jgi:hypothetical protein
MSESLKNILSRRGDNEPPEVATIKRFILERFSSPSSVTLGKGQIVISVKSAALAGTLRMHTRELQKLIRPKVRLIIRIG